MPIAPRPGLSFVLNDADAMGRLAAERIRDVLGGKGRIIVVGVNSLSPGKVERANAFEQALLREAPGVHIERKLVGQFSFGQAELATEQAILADPDAAAIVALGINETRGAFAAVRSTGTSGKIKIIGCDQTLDLLFLLRRGDIDSLVVEDTRAMGRLAVDEIADERNGKPAPPRTYVEPTLVTRANVDDPAIQQILSSRWRPQQ